VEQEKRVKTGIIFLTKYLKYAINLTCLISTLMIKFNSFEKIYCVRNYSIFNPGTKRKNNYTF